MACSSSCRYCAHFQQSQGLTLTHLYRGVKEGDEKDWRSVAGNRLDTGHVSSHVLRSGGCGHKSVHVLEGEWPILVHRQRLTLRLKGQGKRRTEWKLSSTWQDVSGWASSSQSKSNAVKTLQGQRPATRYATCSCVEIRLLY